MPSYKENCILKWMYVGGETHPTSEHTRLEEEGCDVESDTFERHASRFWFNYSFVKAA